MYLLKNKTFLAALAGVLAGTLIVVFISAVPSAHANIFQDLWQKLTAPFQSASSSISFFSSRPTSSAPLYKPAIDYERSVIDSVKSASPAVVSITISKYVPVIEQCPYNPFSDLPPEFQQFFGDQNQQFYQPCQTGKKKLQEIGGGSGFIVSSSGLILTNKHVVADANASYTVLLNDGRKMPAKVLARDPLQDLAVLKVDSANLLAVRLGDSDSIELGQTAIAIGNALGEFRNTVSVGVVSGLSRTVSASGPGVGEETISGVVQTDAAINPGNSGGPLLNLRGEVIAINTAIASGAQNIGFAIPINRAKHDIQSVEKSGEIQVPFLGVRYLTITSDLAEKEKLPVDYGALVKSSDKNPAVQPNSPAEKAGIKAGDIILSVNGQKVDQDHTLGDIISQFSVGDAVALEINRGGKAITLQITLEKRPEKL